MEANRNEGRRVFFIYPHSVFRESLVLRLIDLEYEIYLIKDHSLIPHIIKQFPDAIVFMNIDDGQDREAWKRFIKELQNSSEATNVSLGIISYEFDQAVAQFYLMELALPGGYIQLKQSIEKAFEILTKTLEANEVRGRRKFVRCQVAESKAPQFNVKAEGGLMKGRVLDISSAGMAVVLDDEREFQKNTLLRDIQVNLSGKLLRVSGVVIGFRIAGEEEGHNKKTFVLLFDKSVSSETRSDVRNFVHKQLQEQLNENF